MRASAEEKQERNRKRTAKPRQTILPHPLPRSASNFPTQPLHDDARRRSVSASTGSAVGGLAQRAHLLLCLRRSCQRTHQRNCQKEKMLDRRAVKIASQRPPHKLIFLNASLSRIDPSGQRIQPYFERERGSQLRLFFPSVRTGAKSPNPIPTSRLPKLEAATARWNCLPGREYVQSGHRGTP